MDRLRALEVFIAIAETSSLAAAARQLALSAPSVTRILNDYERELGVQLFHRTTRAVSLTGPGDSFLQSARRIVQDYHEATDALRGAHREPAGVLRITAPVLFGQYYITPLLRKFMARYPKIKVEAIFLDRNVNLIEEGFDLAVRIGPLADSTMVATQVAEVRKVVCASPDYLARAGTPNTLEALSEHTLISISPLSLSAHWDFKDKRRIHVSSDVQLSSIAAAIDMVESGWGLAQVLSYQIGPKLNANTLTTVLNAYEPTALPVNLLHLQGRAASAKVRAFVDMAREALRVDPRLHSGCANHATNS
ncbi:MAG: LysR substrate-binding domain-containing protein [Pseudomonadales bacterium]